MSALPPLVDNQAVSEGHQHCLVNLDAKDLFFFYATGVTPAMTIDACVISHPSA
jgi:hypothetical protein